MDRIILIACAVLVVLNIYSELVLATPRYEPSIDSSKYKDDDSKITPLWFGPRLGRRKRNLKVDSYKPRDQDLAEIWEVLGESPTAVVTINGNDKFICRNMQGNHFSIVEGKRDAVDFVPRLGRNLEDISGNEKWLRDTMTADVDERSPPFAPRLGRKLSPYSPRLGRES